MNKLDYTYMTCMHCNRVMVIKKNKTLKNCVACDSTALATFKYKDIHDDGLEEWAKCIVE